MSAPPYRYFNLLIYIAGILYVVKYKDMYIYVS